MTDFCKNCGNILIIIKKLPDVEADSADSVDSLESIKSTESTESEKSEEIEEELDEETELFYEKILSDLSSNKKLTDDQIKKIDIKDMIRSKYYKTLKSKSNIKKQILTLIEDMGNTDKYIDFYLYCENCGYWRGLDDGFRILDKNPMGVPSISDYTDDSVIRNNVHFGIYPRTKDFKCPEKCPNPEAFMMRDNNSYKMIYVCVSCLSIKRL